jgi:hypothetical protein
VFTNANTSVHQPGQGMPQTNLQQMLFKLDDMGRPTLKIKEDMEFQRGLSIKQIMETCSLGKLITFSCVSTFGTIAS